MRLGLVELGGDSIAGGSAVEDLGRGQLLEGLRGDRRQLGGQPAGVSGVPGAA